MSTTPGTGPPASVRVFLNYRREDSSAYAGRLFDSLEERFGHDSVFMDIDNIAPGSDFLDVITEALKDCVVMLVVIGRSWLTMPDRDGTPRIQQSDDFVRTEIEVALTSGMRVIPILVGGASMPDSDELPTSLAALARRHAIELTDQRWRSDIEDIHKAVSTATRAVSAAAVSSEVAPIASTLPLSEVEPAGSTPPSSGVETKLSRRRRWPTIASAVAVLLVATLVVSIVARQSTSQPTSTTVSATTVTPGLASTRPWIEERPAPEEATREQVAATVVGNRIWVLGGLDKEESTKTVEFYETTTNHWDEGPPLPIPLDHAMAVTFKGQIVVLGGFNNSVMGALGPASARVLRLVGQHWEDLEPLRHARGAGAAAVVGDKIVVTGGQTGTGDGKLVAETEIFDGETETWTEGAPIKVPVEHTAAVSYGQYLYVIGGRVFKSSTNKKTVQRYDSLNNSWKLLPDMTTARGSLGAAIVDTRIVVVGGEDKSAVSGTVTVFDIATEQWRPLKPLTHPRHGLGVVAVGPGAIYAIEGSCGLGHFFQPCAWTEMLDLTG